MFSSAQQTIGTTVLAPDGEIGKVHDLYFDDHEWVVRYYVIDTGKWLPGQKVLIPPHARRSKQSGETGLPVALTREQVRSSPEMDTERPVSRQAEIVLHRHHGWTPYWIPLAPATPVAIEEGDAAERERQVTSGQTGGDPHLRSAKETIGYHVAATDGEIGHIEDFLIDDATVAIRYAVVDTSNWLPERLVAVRTAWIREVQWAESKVFVNVTRDVVRNSPPYDPAAPHQFTG